jgi:hypothetical protein
MERASRGGQEPEEYVRHLIERDASAFGPDAAQADSALDTSVIRPAADHILSDSEFEQLLGELSSGSEVPHLPAGFSRADIYADHD